MQLQLVKLVVTCKIEEEKDPGKVLFVEIYYVSYLNTQTTCCIQVLKKHGDGSLAIVKRMLKA